jgi:molybdopterin molybdotransferase
MVEETREQGGRVQLSAPVRVGQHVRARGEDIQPGDVLLEPGETLGAAAIGVLAAARRSAIHVARRPTVAILSTGDELRDLDQPLEPGAIAESNSRALAALVREAGGTPRLLPLCPDERARLAAAIDEARSADLIVSSGGVSVGDHDHVKAVLAELGAVPELWRVDMKPGKPLYLARLGAVPYYGLPGNPVSSLVSFLLFVRPAIRAALGCQRPLDHPRADAALRAPLTVRSDRPTYLRARLALEDGRLVAEPMPRQGSGVSTSMLRANGLVVLPAGEHALAAGARVSALVIGPL